MVAFLEITSFVHLQPPSPAISACRRRPFVRCATIPATAVAPEVESQPADRTAIRLGLPSKGRMAEDTLALLKNCQLTVRQVNPRQYVADIPQLSNLEVWFQRPKDVVRKLSSGDLDLGIVGLDTVSEYGQGDEDLIIVHDALKYGGCRLSIAIPKCGIFENINSLHDLAQMSQWTREAFKNCNWLYLSWSKIYERKRSGICHLLFC